MPKLFSLMICFGCIGQVMSYSFESMPASNACKKCT